MEHKNIRDMKEDDVSLTLKNFKKMEFTQNVSDEFSSHTPTHTHTVRLLNVSHIILMCSTGV